MADALLLLAVSFVGQIVWILSPEAMAILYGRQISPPLVGLLCATGQLPMHLLLYAGGARILPRLPFMARTIERTRTRLSASARPYLATTFVSAIIGLPPIVAMTALAAGFGIGPRRLLAVTYAGRLIRFTTLAAGGASLVALL